VISVVFAYEVEEGATAEFERVYGSEGEWARFFFRAGEDYLGTELQPSVEGVARYLPIDRWTTEVACSTSCPYDTDYLFLREGSLARALEALGAAGHLVR
jgi:hypothetical protein